MALLSPHNIVAIETYSSPCGRQSSVTVSLSRTGRGLRWPKTRDRHSAATRRTRTMRRRDSLFVRDRRGRDGGRRGTEKAKKQRCQKMYQDRRGGVFRVTREQSRELPSFRPMSGTLPVPTDAEDCGRTSIQIPSSHIYLCCSSYAHNKLTFSV